MTRPQARDALIAYWLESSEESLASAGAEYSAGRFRIAINRAYYACFYAASAALLGKGKQFVKHKDVRAALHEHLVKTRQITSQGAKTFDRLFDLRHEVDYGEFIKIDADTAQSEIAASAAFVQEIRKLLK